MRLTGQDREHSEGDYGNFEYAMVAKGERTGWFRIAFLAIDRVIRKTTG